ncbi:MAG: S1C family serine protease [bacterium]
MEERRRRRAVSLRTFVLGAALIAGAVLLGVNTIGRKEHPGPRTLVPATAPHPLHSDTSRSDEAVASEAVASEAVASEALASQSLEEEITSSRRNAIVRAIERVEPAVVSITVTQIIRTRVFPSIFDDPFLRRFFPEFRREYKRRVYSIGSGFIISQDGSILTNEHVIENAQEIVVTLTSGKQAKGELVGSDPRLDLAVIKIEEENLPHATLGDSDELIIGEWAIAIGNPFGFVLDKSKPTVTVGVISAVDRDFESNRGGRIYKDMIQTDAAINLGNSGGPLVNSNGEVIGINTFIFTGGQYSEGSIGIGFAIPINKAKKVTEELLSYGRIRDFWTGISIQNIDWLMAQSLDLKSTEGAIISQIDPGSPGEEAGLKVGDIIKDVNGEKVKDTDDVIKTFAEGQVGDVYTLIVQRQGKERTVQLRLKEASP